MSRKTQRLLWLSSVLLVPLIGPLIMHLRGDRENLAAVVAWPFLYCIAGLYVSSLRAAHAQHAQDKTLGHDIRWYSAANGLALFLLCLFEFLIAMLVQAPEAPMVLWIIAFAGLYAPYVGFSLWGDHLLRRTDSHLNSSADGQVPAHDC